MDQLLSSYESVVSEAAGAGIDIVTQDFTISWDYIQSVFFSTTILTTIGMVINIIIMFMVLPFHHHRLW